MEGDDNAPPMARRILIPVLAAAALLALPSTLGAARDVTSLKQRVEAVEARAALNWDEAH